MASPFGPAVVDGVPRYTSVSSLQTFDPNTYAGCNRRWHYDKVGGIKEPETEAQARGKQLLHQPIEGYYATGARAFGPLILPIVKWLPPREPSSGREAPWVEWELAPHLLADPVERLAALERRAIGLPIDVPMMGAPELTAGGIPLAGQIDLSHDWREWINLDGETAYDPDVDFEVIDWKSTSKREYAKTGVELASAIQMAGYAEYRFRLNPRAERGRLSHVYTLSKGKSDGWKVSTVADREAVARRWAYVDGLGRGMRDAAAEPDVEKIPGNPRSCGAYYKGCPHREYCSVARASNAAAQTARAASIFGAAASTLFAARPVADDEEEEDILTVVSKPAADDLLNDLLAEEAAQTGAPAAPQVDAEIGQAMDEIEGRGYGTPPYSGWARDQRIASRNPPTSFTGAEIPGSGKLGGLPKIEAREGVIKLRDDLRRRDAKVAASAPALAAAPAAAVASPPAVVHVAQPGAAGIVSPQTPASNPALAAAPAPGLPTPPVAPPVKDAPPEPKPAPTPEPVTPAALVAASNPEAPPAKKAPKVKPAAPKMAPGAPTGGKDPIGVGEPVELYVDCGPLTEPYASIDDWISYWTRGLAHHYKVGDVRSADKSIQALAFGAWRGLLAEAVNYSLKATSADPAHLPPGRYAARSGSDFADIVIEAMTLARRQAGDAPALSDPNIVTVIRA